jgi:molybdopterin synthase sulfur carrier subunit
VKVKVRIPTPLQKLTDSLTEVEGEGKDIQELLNNLISKFPALKDRLYDEEGKLRKFINFYVNEEDIRFLQGENTSLKDGDVVSIIPAIAGG